MLPVACSSPASEVVGWSRPVRVGEVELGEVEAQVVGAPVRRQHA